MSEPVYVFSAGLWRLSSEVGLISGLEPRRTWLRAGKRGAIAGWGHKPTADRARAEARRTGLPYLAFEDGFLRSVKPGPSQPPVSMVMDRSGIYYDARQPSDLETILREEDFDERDGAAALAVADEIRKRRLSKYNHAPDRLAGLPALAGRKLAVVIDQTRDDASIAGGLASAASFQRMFEAAIAENPGAVVAAKLHPETVAGSKAGYLREAAAGTNAVLLTGQMSPWALLDHAPHVYTVSSQFGFEALLAGCKVTCFGAPFYAGWGLTDDRIAIPRRGRSRSPGDIAAAVYLRYSHYFDAWRRVPVDALTAIDQLDFLKRRYLGNDQPVVVSGVSRWKRRAVSAMLEGPAGPPRFAASAAEARRLAKATGAVAAAWGMAADDFRAQGDACIAIEDGFIRSAGLGAAFVAPMSLVFDRRGLYYDPRQPSDIEELLRAGRFDPAVLAEARRLVQRIVAERVTKYNLPDGGSGLHVPAGRPVVLVPGQVTDDAAVIAGEAAGAPAGANVNATLLAAVRARQPGAFVIFKPHPDVEQLGRRGALTANEELRGADAVVRGASIDTLLPLAQRVETYSSLTGFEALLRGIPVTVHGLPFYAGWGLTDDLVRCARRGSQRSLAELAAASLICYARYWDPQSGLPCPPDVVLDRIAASRQAAAGVATTAGRLAGRLVVAWRNWSRRSGTGNGKR